MQIIFKNTLEIVSDTDSSCNYSIGLALGMRCGGNVYNQSHNLFIGILVK